MTRRRHPGDPIRVLHLLPWMAAGGVERRRLTLAEELPSPRFEQHVICQWATPAFTSALAAAGVPLHAIGGRWTAADVASIGAIRRRVRQIRPDIIHGAVFEGVTMATLGALGFRDAAVVLEEIDMPVARSRRADWLLRALSLRATRVVGVSAPVSSYLKDRVGIPKEKVRTIVNGVRPRPAPTEEVLRRVRRDLGLPPNAFVVGSVGRMLDAHKRFSDLLRASSLLVEDGVDLHLVLVGEGPDREALERLAKELGIEGRAHFTGHREDVGTFLAAMDLFALASSRESFGLVLVEAMLAGLPIVCTGVGGMAEVVEPDETAWVVPVGDVPALADAIRRLLEDADLRRAMGARGRDRAGTFFSAEAYARSVAHLYEEVVGERRRSSS